MSENRLGTRKSPTKLRLALIAVGAFVIALIWIALSGGQAKADVLALPSTCYSDGGYAVSHGDPNWEDTVIDCRDAYKYGLGLFDFDTRPFDEKFQKYGGAVAIGCAGGFAAGSGPGAIYGCTAAALAALWDSQF